MTRPLSRSRCRCTVLGLALSLALLTLPAAAEGGYEAWLRYRPVTDATRLAEYRGVIGAIEIEGEPTPILRAAAGELSRGLTALLDRPIGPARRGEGGGAVVVLSTGDDPLARDALAELAASDAGALRPEGFLLRAGRDGGRDRIQIIAGDDRGALYGAFALLRRMQLYKRGTA